MTYFERRYYYYIIIIKSGGQDIIVEYIGKKCIILFSGYPRAGYGNEFMDGPPQRGNFGMMGGPGN